MLFIRAGKLLLHLQPLSVGEDGVDDESHSPLRQKNVYGAWKLPRFHTFFTHIHFTDDRK